MRLLKTPPIPEPEEKRLVQAEVNLHLFQAVEKEAKKRELKIRQVVEFGLESFLLATNPTKAKELGISPKVS